MAKKAGIEAVVAGHICLDITPEMPEGKWAHIGELIRPGTLVKVGAVGLSTGGAVSNTGVVLGKLGVNVALMGKCGNDPLGHVIVEILKKQAPGSEAGMRIVTGEKTSYTVVLAVPGFDRTFLHCPGANDTFGATDVDWDLVSQARLFHFGYPSLMRRMYQRNGTELVKIFRTAKSKGVVTSLDFSLPDPRSEVGRVDWPGVLAKLLPHVDMFMPSAEELLFLLDKAHFLSLSAKVPTGGTLLDVMPIDTIRDLAGRCLAMGVRVCVVKCGSHGTYAKTACDGTHPGADWAGRELFEPSFKVKKIVTATGAGDNAIAGFLAAYLKGRSLVECLSAMTMCGAQNLSAFDAVSGVKSWPDTQARLAAKPPKNKVSLDLSGWRCDKGARLWAGPDDGG